jgi:hypothetical protein
MKKAAMKKGRNDFVSTFFSFRHLLNSGDGSPVLNLRLASTLPRRLGLVDRGLMIPAVAAVGFADGRRGEIACGFGLVMAASAESRPAPGRKLVDLGRSLIQTRIHHRLSLGRSIQLRSACFEDSGFMVRPTRS